MLGLFCIFIIFNKTHKKTKLNNVCLPILPSEFLSLTLSAKPIANEGVNLQKHIFSGPQKLGPQSLSLTEEVTARSTVGV